MQKCVRCFNEYDPANNVFGSCVWHSSHNLAKANPQYVTFEEELRTMLPKFKASIGKVDIDYVVKRIPLRDLMLQIDSEVTRAIKAKAEAIPESTAKFLFQCTLEKLYQVIPSNYSYDKQYPPTRRIALIMENFLSSMRIEDIDALLSVEAMRLQKEFRYPHQHLFQGRDFDRARNEYVWRCCGLPGNSDGCWRGIHSSIKRSPDPFTVEDFDGLNYFAFYTRTNFIVNGSEHVNNKLTNETLRAECVAGINAWGLAPERKKFIEHVTEFNFYNGYEPAFRYLEGVGTICEWSESQRVQSFQRVGTTPLVEFDYMLSKIRFPLPRSELTQYTVFTVIQKITRSRLRTANVFRLGSPRQETEVYYIPSFVESPLPENTLLLPNQGTNRVPRNPVTLTPAFIAEFEKLPTLVRGNLRRRVARITNLSNLEWAPYEAERQQQIADVLTEYARQQREVRKRAKRKASAEQILREVEQYVADSAQVPGSEALVQVVEKLVKEQYSKFDELTLDQQKLQLEEMQITTQLADVVLRQVDLQNLISSGEYAIEQPLDQANITNFKNDMNQILQQAATLRTEYEQALTNNKSSKEVIDLGRSMLGILDKHINFLSTASNSAIYDKEVKLIKEASGNVIETLSGLRDIFIKGRLGQAASIGDTVTKKFYDKLVKFDKRSKNWQLRSELPGYTKSQRLTRLYKFYNVVQKFKDRHSPENFNTKVKKPKALQYSNDVSVKLKDALELMVKRPVDNPDALLRIATLLNDSVEISKLWYIEAMGGSDDTFQGQKAAAKPLAYTKVNRDLFFDIQIFNQYLEDFLKTEKVETLGHGRYYTVRMPLFKFLLDYCLEEKELQKFAYKLRDWILIYRANYDFYSRPGKYEIAIDPIFCFPILGKLETPPETVGVFVEADVHPCGYSIETYKESVEENLKILILLQTKLPTGDLKKALRKILETFKGQQTQTKEFIQKCESYENSNFVELDDLFSSLWEKIEQAYEKLGITKNFDASSVTFEAFSKYRDSLFDVTDLLSVYLKTMSIRATERSVYDPTLIDKEKYKTIRTKEVLELVNTLIELMKKINWTKRFRGKRGISTITELWYELNVPLEKFEDKGDYSKKCVTLLELLKKYNLFDRITTDQLRTILGAIKASNRNDDITKYVMVLESSCRVTLTRYMLPLSGVFNDILQLLEENLKELELNPKYILRPPKGKKLRMDRKILTPMYELEA